jgi:hypothetical protein
LIKHDRLEVEVSPDGIGCADPDSGHVKTLWIDYRWDGGPVQKIHEEEWADHPGGTPNRIVLPTT